MADLMIDLEGLGTGPDTTILTIAAQAFDPLGSGYLEQKYYARITLESQENRSIQQSTIDWWATQPAAARDEAFCEEGRIDLDQALDSLGKLIWHSKRIWAQGPTYDMNILEHAYKSYGKPIPWQFYAVRDSRTVFSLWPDLPKPPTSHHALEDCRRQIALVQTTLKHFNIKELA
jgi:exodeoxyribonuclease VIII